MHKETILRDFDTLYGGIPSGRSSMAKFVIMPQDLNNKQESDSDELPEERKSPLSHAEEQQNGSMSDELSQKANQSSSGKLA